MGADKSLARPTSLYILFDGENISKFKTFLGPFPRPQALGTAIFGFPFSRYVP